MRPRDRILTSLENAYREAFAAAEGRGDGEEMARLDFQFQRDQIRMEVLLDIRDLLTGTADDGEPARERTSILDEGTALVEKAQALRRIVRLR